MKGSPLAVSLAVPRDEPGATPSPRESRGGGGGSMRGGGGGMSDRYGLQSPQYGGVSYLLY